MTKQNGCHIRIQRIQKHRKIFFLPLRCIHTQHSILKLVYQLTYFKFLEKTHIVHCSLYVSRYKWQPRGLLHFRPPCTLRAQTTLKAFRLILYLISLKLNIYKTQSVDIDIIVLAQARVGMQ